MTFTPLSIKAAGHDGPMQNDDGSLFIKPANDQEIQFYNETQNKSLELGDDVPYGSSLADWMPQYIGVLYPGASNDLIEETNGTIDEKLLTKATNTLEIEGENKKYLILGNVLHGFSQPSVLDIKLGSILYDEGAKPEKVERMKKVSRTTTSGTLKFRIAGMMIPDSFHEKLPLTNLGFNIAEVCSSTYKNGYLTFDKYFGRRLTKETVDEGLKLFFRYNKLPETVQNIIIRNFHSRLQLLYNCLLDEEVRVVSGSLFFVFENDISRWEKAGFEDPVIVAPTISEDEEEDEEEYENRDGSLKEGTNSPLSCLKFIDFAHARYTPNEGYDEEVVSGIEKLFSIIEKI